MIVTTEDFAHSFSFVRIEERLLQGTFTVNDSLSTVILFPRCSLVVLLVALISNLPCCRFVESVPQTIPPDGPRGDSNDGDQSSSDRST